MNRAGYKFLPMTSVVLLFHQICHVITALKHPTTFHKHQVASITHILFCSCQHDRPLQAKLLRTLGTPPRVISSHLTFDVKHLRKPEAKSQAGRDSFKPMTSTFNKISHTPIVLGPLQCGSSCGNDARLTCLSRSPCQCSYTPPL